MNWSQNNKYVSGIALLCLLLLGVLEGCFYEEGPVSFKSRAKRFGQTWDYQRVYENGIIKTPSYFIDYVDFTKQGDATFILKDGSIFEGTWEFNRHKDRVLFTLDDGNGNPLYLEWSIEMLTKTTLKAEEYTMGDHFRYELRIR